MVILSASGVGKSYGINTILQDVSFHINEGDRIGIIGDNGAGKSTLLSILTGALSYDTGELFMSSQIDVGYLKQHDISLREYRLSGDAFYFFRNKWQWKKHA